MTVKLGRPPTNDDELHAVVKAFWGVSIPRVAVCEGHVAPFTAFAHAYFAKEPNWALWYASRGSGKSYMLAILALTKCLVQDVDITLLGGSMAQSQNVHEHVERLLAQPHAPSYALGKDPTATEILSVSGKTIRPLPASQKTVRGPHPNCTLLDEIDEMEYPIYSAAMGQAMPKPGVGGVEVPEYVVASSTWQNADATFTRVKQDAEDKGFPVFTFCYRENLRPHGWMSEEYVERKRASVPREMFRVEYDLGEPSGTSRAFDLETLDQVFVELPEVRRSVKKGDEEFVLEEPAPDGIYCMGADWAKETDWTVIAVFRLDHTWERRCVYFRRMQRRPYPEMISAFTRVRALYHDALAVHDATGLGNVVHDMIEDGVGVTKFVMVGRNRTQMLTDYITAVEHRKYVLPRQTRAFYEHRFTTVEDVYASAQWNSHLPDTVAAFALAHRAAEKLAPPADPSGIAHDPTPRKVTAGLFAEPQYPDPYGAVVVHEEPDDVLVFDGRPYDPPSGGDPWSVPW